MFFLAMAGRLEVNLNLFRIWNIHDSSCCFERVVCPSSWREAIVPLLHQREKLKQSVWHPGSWSLRRSRNHRVTSGAFKKKWGGEGAWKHQEAQSLPEARSNLPSSRHIPLRFGFVFLKEFNDLTFMGSPVCFQFTILCITAVHLPRWSGRVQVTGGETQGGAALSGKAQKTSDISQSDCNVEFIANWVDVWTCNQSIANFLSQEWSHNHLHAAPWRGAEWGKACPKYLPRWKFWLLAHP